MNDRRKYLVPSLISDARSPEIPDTESRCHHAAALAEAVKPIEKISDIRIFDTGGLLGGGSVGAGDIGGGGGLGLGDGLASQLLLVSAFKPMIDKILTEAGFAAGPDAFSSLTMALAAKQLGDPVEPPAVSSDSPTPPTTISGPGKATLGPRS